MDQAIYEGEVQESSRLTTLKLGIDETDEKSQGIRDDLELQLDGLTPQCGKRSISELIGIYLEKLYTYSIKQSERHGIKMISVRQRSNVLYAYLHCGTMRSVKRWSKWRQGLVAKLAFRNLN